MKKFIFGLLVISFVTASVKVIPCMGMAMECCQAASQVSLSSTYQPCCDEGTSLKLASLAVAKKESHGLEGILVASLNRTVFQETYLELRCGEPNKKRPPKSSLYLQHSALLL